MSMFKNKNENNEMLKTRSELLTLHLQVPLFLQFILREESQTKRKGRKQKVSDLYILTTCQYLKTALLRLTSLQNLLEENLCFYYQCLCMEAT